MEVKFLERGYVEFKGANLIFKNFSGRGDKFNREGDRKFAIRIHDPETADALIEAGWNVKIKSPREEGEDAFMNLPVKLKFNSRGPSIYLESGSRVNQLDEETVGCLDQIDILTVDLVIRPYDWETPAGLSGRTAYLQSMAVVQELDHYAERYADRL